MTRGKRTVAYDTHLGIEAFRFSGFDKPFPNHVHDQAVKTSAYIYMSPVITVLTAAIVLAEPVTLISCVGVILTLSGLIISENVRASRKSIRKTSMST